MNSIRLASAITLALLIAGCGAKQGAASEQQTGGSPSAAPAANSVYSGNGAVKAIAGDQVSIAHGPIAGIGWPAMTMTFTAPPGMATGVKVGSQVNFSFRRSGSAFVLTSLKSRR